MHRTKNNGIKYFSKMRSVMVTGTNGKSTTTDLIASIIGLSKLCAKITTLNAEVKGIVIPYKKGQFIQNLDLACAHRVGFIAIETTSKALEKAFASQYRRLLFLFVICLW